MNPTTMDEKIVAWRDLRRAQAKKKRIGSIASVVAGLGWLLFFNKIGQTSEMALRYSQEAQESIGSWVIVLTLMTLFAAFMMISAGRAKGRLGELTGQLTLQLRHELDGADTARKPAIESQLRELGA
ncbi:hypothetical protein [Parasphingorhabdus sp.]|uniref:hypothetical protein n=1 Tax=Parasphingorhabdus sp. TaxID=2709688 RepID=UPI003A8D05C1